MKKSGYYWRCACGFEDHSYTQLGLDLARNHHGNYHRAVISRIVCASMDEEAAHGG